MAIHARAATMDVDLSTSRDNINMRLHLQPWAALVCASCLSTPLLAQTPDAIERIRPTDNDLSCAQIADERNAMDTAIAQAKAAQSSGQTTAVAGQAGAVAAEVAGRTGLFGSIGGLAGQLFGATASKAAANAATDQGNRTATQAAERERQALARKEQLAQLSLSKKCSSSEAAEAPATTASASAVPAATPSVAGTLPAAPTFAQPVIGVVNGKYLKDVKRVAVASFTVQFVEAQIGEVKTSSKLGTAGGVTLTQVSSRVVGVDFTEAFQRDQMQETTNALYQDLLGELKAAGLDVVPPEKLLASDTYKKFAAQGAKTPRVEDAEAEKGSGQGAIRSVFMTPPGIPLVIKAGSGGQDIDYLTRFDSVIGSSVVDHTLTFTGRLGLYTTNFNYYEKDVQKELDTATLHVRVLVPLAVIEVDSGMNWSKAKIVPGVLLGKRFTRMTVGVNSDYTYVFLKEDLQVPGVIRYTVEETPHPNSVRAMLGEKERKYPATMNLPRYWSDVSAATRHVFRTFSKTLADGQKGL